MRHHRETMVLAGLCSFLLIATLAFNAAFQRSQENVPEHLLYFPDAEKLHTYAPDYQNAVADLLWMRTLIYFGDHNVTDKNYRYLTYMLDVITQLNPRYQPAYYMAATVLPWIPNAIADSNRLMIRAMIYMPDQGQWPYYLGLNNYLFNDNKIMASHYLSRAISRGFVNRMSAGLAVRIRMSYDSLSAAHDMLIRSISTTKDAHLRAYLTEQMQKVETEKILRHLERKMQELGMHDTMMSLKPLQDAGLQWPRSLPDGGHLLINKYGKLRSSASPSRLALHVSTHVRTMQGQHP